MHHADLYYALAFGHYPYESQTAYEETCLTVQRLIDNGYSEKQIEAFVEEAAVSRVPVFSKDWDYGRAGNLLEQGKFYYHKELQLTSPAPMFNPATGLTSTSPFYLEMRMYYSTVDLGYYLANKVNIPYELRDAVKEAGAIDYLLKKYSKIGSVSAIDFVLFLADEAAFEGKTFTNILDIQQYDVLVLDKVKRATAEAASKGANQVVWRTVG